MNKYQPDFHVGGGGTIYTLEPLSPAAEAWLADNMLDLEPWQKLGNAVCIEHRYIGPIVEAIKRDGLIVK